MENRSQNQNQSNQQPNGYVVDEKEKGYYHVRVTHKGGQPVAAPYIQKYYPHVFIAISRQPGYIFEILYKPV